MNERMIHDDDDAIHSKSTMANERVSERERKPFSIIENLSLSWRNV